MRMHEALPGTKVRVTSYQGMPTYTVKTFHHAGMVIMGNVLNPYTNISYVRVSFRRVRNEDWRSSMGRYTAVLCAPEELEVIE